MKRKNPNLELKYLLKNYPINKGEALDIGCGYGADSEFLARNDFIVTGIDRKKYLKEELLTTPSFKFEKRNIEEFDFGEYDLINAQWVLPFIKKDRFEDIVFKCKKALKPNGYFLGQFLGVDDEWKNQGLKMNFITKSKAMKLLFGLEILKFAEIRQQGFTASKKPKYWHYFEFIVKKHT